ncbi:MAG: GNAT family N-acetyltransferase [Gammaproteobacteria bacterium]
MSDPADLLIRPIRPGDDAAVAAIIHEVMASFGATGPGYSSDDPEVEAMSAAHDAARAAYFVLEEDGRVVGCGGIAPLAGADDHTCELRKMYLLPAARGRGLGRAMLQRCLEAATGRGYRRCYLETLSAMEAAQALYVQHGFQRLPAPLGTTGHSGCNRHYLLEL